MGRIHEASLVDASLHPAALLDLLALEPSKPLFDYVADAVMDVVDYALGKPSSSSGSRSPSTSTSTTSRNPKFRQFVTDVLTRAEVSTPSIVSTLVYVDRAKPHLHIALEDWACERVFLGAVVLASKYTNDSTLKNVHWAMCTGVFGRRDVLRIEREMLDVLDFELGIQEHDVLAHLAPLSALLLPPSPPALAATFAPASNDVELTYSPSGETFVDESSSFSDDDDEDYEIHSDASSDLPNTPHTLVGAEDEDMHSQHASKQNNGQFLGVPPSHGHQRHHKRSSTSSIGQKTMDFIRQSFPNHHYGPASHAHQQPQAHGPISVVA